MQVEQRHEDAAAVLWLDIIHKEREPEYACNSDAWHKLYAETFARFEASLSPSAPVDREAWAELLCDNFEARLIAEQVEAPLYRDSEPHVQAYWQALAAITPSVLAESTSNDCLLVAEAVRERCAQAAANWNRHLMTGSPHETSIKIASAIRSLDLSGVGVG
jgi:hypothetical protein